MATITQTRQFLSTNGQAQGFGSFAKFDQSLGTLTAVDLHTALTSKNNISAENLDQQGVTLAADTTMSSYVNITSSNWLVLYAAAQAAGTASVALGSYDGVSDFAGSSGTNSLTVTGLGSGDDSRSGTDNLSLFEGTGELQAVYGTWFSSLNMAAGVGLRVRSDLINTIDATLTYTFDPAVVPTGNTDGSVVTTVRNNTDSNFTVVSAPPSSFTAPTVTTQAQTFTFAPGSSTWATTAKAAQFDSSAGVLRSVNLLLSGSFVGRIAAENFDPVTDGYAYATQSLTAKVSAAGVADPLATTAFGTASLNVYLGAYDGSTDFGGASGAMGTASQRFGSSSTQVTDGTTLAAFTGSGTIDLGVATAGSSTWAGTLTDMLSELTATSDATLSVSYTYEPAGPVTPILVETKSGVATPTPTEYTGPVAGVFNEFAQITPENVAISINTDGWYVRTGDGDDAIHAVGGVNVLDGGRGSNFLTGGAGMDTFFVDAQWVSAPIWSTIVDLMPGDAVTVWGLTGSEQVNFWRDNEGAAGATGLTLHARMPFSPFVSVTLAGYSKADLDSGRLVTSYGTSDDVPYFYIRAA